jgi:hypothetical protein
MNIDIKMPATATLCQAAMRFGDGTKRQQSKLLCRYEGVAMALEAGRAA